MCGDGREQVDGVQGAEPTMSAVRHQPEHAWKVLSITNEWIRHADAKTGVTLAFAGATATMLFNLLNRQGTVRTPGLWIASLIGVAAILGTTTCAGLALIPRVKPKKAKSGEDGTAAGPEEVMNLLFFGDVHRGYADDRPTYREVLGMLTTDPERLTGQVADQIHANAHVATQKFRWADRAIRFELVAALAVGATSFLVAMGW